VRSQGRGVARLTGVLKVEARILEHVLALLQAAQRQQAVRLRTPSHTTPAQECPLQ